MLSVDAAPAGLHVTRTSRLVVPELTSRYAAMKVAGVPLTLSDQESRRMFVPGSVPAHPVARPADLSQLGVAPASGRCGVELTSVGNQVVTPSSDRASSARASVAGVVRTITVNTAVSAAAIRPIITMTMIVSISVKPSEERRRSVTLDHLVRLDDLAVRARHAQCDELEEIVRVEAGARCSGIVRVPVAGAVPRQDRLLDRDL